MPTKVTRSAKPAPKPHKPTFPIRKPALAKASDHNITPMNSAHVKAHYVGTVGFHAWTVANYACFGALLLTAIWGGFYVHRTLALAEVGAVTCSAENSYMWVMDDPGSDVPRMNDVILHQCAKAYNPLQ
jgi:hypothetical protein